MSSDSSDTQEGQPGLGQAALRGLCPRCGANTLFGGMLAFADKCRACGLDFWRFNVGDGPAALVTLAVGTITVGLAIWLQLSVEPPLWVHALLWVPLTFALVIGGLRVAKAWLLASEYRNNAREAGSKDL
ncbi:DUF983 domain-containing protein [Qipengyuania sp. 6B39]|uniref:DUF983 domain-containing protein n=1 Tax=Qipengyuania proteolytica TaxID=2867239 RepID=UPI001C894537|nr:DUF983 domain-containing protein [Qipengyuania proteolytica]MBX7495599.1 DUF983 domain-containing protein [Qipengyuania proteolytica]